MFCRGTKKFEVSRREAAEGEPMISAKRALSISMEPDQEKRDALVDKLTEADAKYLLKVALSAMQEKEWRSAVK